MFEYLEENPDERYPFRIGAPLAEWQILNYRAPLALETRQGQFTFYSSTKDSQ